MKENIKNFHVLTTIFLNLVILILILSSDNPLVLFGTSILIFYIFIFSKSLSSVKKCLIYFMPFAALTIIINLIFVHEGRIILFTIFNRAITLESLIYSLALSFKLLLVILVFMMLGIMIDSDKAVSFFSGLMPKTTLTMMISLKMFPGMKKRLDTLREVYSLRGVDFETKGTKNKVKSYMPLLSVMLEDSLESAFNIGEASYVRGFLSGKRTIYDRQRFSNTDYIVLGSSMLLLIIYIVIKILRMDNFSVYNGIELINIVNIGMLIVFASLILLTFGLFWLVKEKENGIYRS